MLDFRALRAFFDAHPSAGRAPVRNFDVGGLALDFSRERYLVGVINLSTDSWYRESVCVDADQAIARGLQLVEDGAHFVDIGAESTLPDAARHAEDAQLEQLLPVVKALSARGVRVSVESYYPRVLARSAEAGAKIFNLTGARAADEVFALAARHEAAVILCYVAGETVREVSDLELLDDPVPALRAYFEPLLARARARGVHRCFVDPGLGFYYKNLTDSEARVRYQLQTFLEATRLHSLGYPVFNILPHAPDVFRDDERRQAEPFFSVLAMLMGTHVIRSHEIRKVARTLAALSLYPEAPWAGR